jgi:hypothetical protein
MSTDFNYRYVSRQQDHLWPVKSKIVDMQATNIKSTFVKSLNKVQKEILQSTNTISYGINYNIKN